jgi:hypothetical protein
MGLIRMILYRVTGDERRDRERNQDELRRREVEALEKLARRMEGQEHDHQGARADITATGKGDR